MRNVDQGLACFWGIIITVMSVASLVNRKTFEGMKNAKQDYALIFLLGLISLLFGALQVSFYNVWAWDHRGVVTAMGWITLVRSCLRLFLPDSNKKALESQKADKVVYPSLVASLALGGYLLAAGLGLIGARG